LNPNATYVRVDGQVVGTGQEILNGAIHSGPWQQGNGTYYSRQQFWSGSAVITVAGTQDGTCNDWGSTASANGIVSDPTVGVGGLFGTFPTPDSCGSFTQEVLLCIEQ